MTITYAKASDNEIEVTTIEPVVEKIAIEVLEQEVVRATEQLARAQTLYDAEVARAEKSRVERTADYEKELAYWQGLLDKAKELGVEAKVVEEVKEPVIEEVIG